MILDKDFFQNVLRNHHNDGSITVLAIGIEQACDLGDNFVSIVKRVQVDGHKIVNSRRIDYSTSLIVKLMHDNEILVKAMNLDKIFQNEITSYYKLIPELSKFTKDGTLPVPICLYANKEVIVLQNLSEDGFVNVDKRVGFTLKQIISILKELAKLHAASLAMSKLGEIDLFELTKNNFDIIFSSSKLLDTQSSTLQIAEKLFKEKPDTPKNRLCIDIIAKVLNSGTDKQRELVSSKRDFRVMNHGDTWGNNILIKGDSVKLIDLQMMRYTSIACDLSYFLYINLKPLVRKENFEKLLQVYLIALHDNLMAVNVDLKEFLTLEWLMNEMNDFALFGFINGLWLLPVFYFDKSDLDLSEYENNVKLGVDVMWKKCSPDFKKVLEQMVIDFVENSANWKNL